MSFVYLYIYVVHLHQFIILQIISFPFTLCEEFDWKFSVSGFLSVIIVQQLFQHHNIIIIIIISGNSNIKKTSTVRILYALQKSSQLPCDKSETQLLVNILKHFYLFI